jgi:hypothetical protein
MNAWPQNECDAPGEFSNHIPVLKKGFKYWEEMLDYGFTSLKPVVVILGNRSLLAIMVYAGNKQVMVGELLTRIEAGPPRMYGSHDSFLNSFHVVQDRFAIASSHYAPSSKYLKSFRPARLMPKTPTLRARVTHTYIVRSRYSPLFSL